MPGSLARFLETLRASGLLSEGELEKFLASIPLEIDAQDPQAVARELIRRGMLTAFQATAIYQGKSKGLVFGEYLVLDKLGAGGMGRVFKAVHRRMQRLVGLKVLPKTALDSPAAIERFEREVRAAAKLLHPNIVAAHDAGVHESIHYLVMEYIDGPDLARLVKDRGKLPVPVAVNYVMQAARGLGYAHSRGVIHRDIKPSNLLVNSEGVVKILDMGLARVNDPGELQPRPSTASLTRTGQIIGTVDYMAPEQAEHTDLADERSDIYSLGCTLYRLLTGSVPFPADSFVKKLLAHRESPPPLLKELCSEAEPPLQALLEKMLAKQPYDRFASMGEVEHALEQMQAGHELRLALAGISPPPQVPRDELATFLSNLRGMNSDGSDSNPSLTVPVPPEIVTEKASDSSTPEGGPGTKRRLLPPAVLWATGVLSVCCLAVLLFPWLMPAPGAVEIRVLTQHLEEAQLTVDDIAVPVGDFVPIQLTLRAGKHTIRMQRRGYQAVIWAFELKPREIRVLEPVWQPLHRRGVRGEQESR